MENNFNLQSYQIMMPKLHIAKSGTILFVVGLIGLSLVYYNASQLKASNPLIMQIAILLGMLVIVGFIIMYKGVRIWSRQRGLG